MGTSHPAVIEVESSRKTSPLAVRRGSLLLAKRQHRSPELKRQIVEETLAPGASVACVARRHGVNANQVFAWRRLYRQGRLRPLNPATPGLAVRVADPDGSTSLTVPPFDRLRDPERKSRGERSRRERSRRVAEAGAPARDAVTRRVPAGTIQVELPKGRLRLTGSVDPEALRVVLEALRG